MRKVSSATVAMILGVALYFTLFWGYDALRTIDLADLTAWKTSGARNSSSASAACSASARSG